MFRALDNQGKELLIGDPVEVMGGVTTKVSHIGPTMGMHQPTVVQLEDGSFLYPKQPIKDGQEGGIFEARNLKILKPDAVDKLRDSLAVAVIKDLLKHHRTDHCHAPDCQMCAESRRVVDEALTFVQGERR